MITVDDYLNHWREHYPQAEVPANELTDDMLMDAQVIVDKANQLLVEFGHDLPLSSGWRPREVNKLIPGAAPHSNHMFGRAIDIADPGNALDGWINANPEILADLDVFRESPDKTKGWVHIQSVRYGSWVAGKSRTFQA